MLHAVSNDWSGYLTEGTNFTFVAASWRVPAVTCTTADSRVSFWVGLSGHASPTIQQDGTGAVCHAGVPRYGMWWEMYASTGSSGHTFYPVSPGDYISAYVRYDAAGYTLHVEDRTNGVHFTVVEACNDDDQCNRNSAQWIVERPGGGKYALANYATFAFVGAQATDDSASGTITAFQDQRILMEHAGTKLSEAGPLTPDGSGFTTTWLADE